MSRAFVWFRTVIVLLLFALSGCATVRVDVRTRPISNRFLWRVEQLDSKRYPIYVDADNREYTIVARQVSPGRPTEKGEQTSTSAKNWQLLHWPTLEPVVDTSVTTSLHRDIERIRPPKPEYRNEPWFNWPIEEQEQQRYREALKVSKWFWGSTIVVKSQPVRYDIYKRRFFDYRTGKYEKWYSPLASMFTPELSLNEFLVEQPGLQKNVGTLSPLEADISPGWTLFFRLVTLGMFWDSGYTTDVEKWAPYNSAKAWGWAGRGQYVLYQDRNDMQFKVKGINFDPSRTVSAVSGILREASLLALQPQIPVTKDDGTLFQDESDETVKSEAQARIKAIQAQLKALGAKKSLETATKLRADLLAYKLQVLQQKVSEAQKVDDAKLDPFRMGFKATSTPSGERFVTASMLNVRKEPSTKGTIIRALKKGSKVTVLQEQGDWRRVKGVDDASKGVEGWVNGAYLSEKAPG